MANVMGIAYKPNDGFSLLKLKIMYITQIISFLSWPVLIYVSYRLILFALKRFGEKVEAQ